MRTGTYTLHWVGTVTFDPSIQGDPHSFRSLIKEWRGGLRKAIDIGDQHGLYELKGPADVSAIRAP